MNKFLQLKNVIWHFFGTVLLKMSEVLLNNEKTEDGKPCDLMH